MKKKILTYVCNIATVQKKHIRYESFDVFYIYIRRLRTSCQSKLRMYNLLLKILGNCKRCVLHRGAVRSMTIVTYACGASIVVYMTLSPFIPPPPHNPLGKRNKKWSLPRVSRVVRRAGRRREPNRTQHTRGIQAMNKKCERFTVGIAALFVTSINNNSKGKRENVYDTWKYLVLYKLS